MHEAWFHGNQRGGGHRQARFESKDWEVTEKWEEYYEY